MASETSRNDRTVDLGHFHAPPAAGQTPAPGIVMLHDVWGLSEHFDDLAGRLAEQGFGVLALEIYRRESEVAIENPGAWMRNLSDPQILSDIEAAAAFLREQPETRGAKVGVVGFCMGGMYALLAGCGPSGIDAAVVYYGLLSHEHGILFDEAGLDPSKKPRQPLDALGDLACPLLALYGEDDEFVPGEDLAALEAGLAESGQSTEVKIYAGAGHAFMNETREEAFRPETASDAWARMLAFLRSALAAE